MTTRADRLIRSFLREGKIVDMDAARPRLAHFGARRREIDEDARTQNLLRKAGVSKVNSPRAAAHGKSSHVVVAKEGDKVRLIRFGQRGVKGSPKKEGESTSYRKRREAFKARHAKNIASGKMSAAYWADKVKW